MKFIKSKNANTNYLAKIVELKSFHNHPNPEVTRLKCAVVDGYNIIVGIDYQPGKFVYFPSGCTINPQFLSWANLYKHADKNVDSEKSGMFEDNGRVKSIKLKGTISEGFLLPLNTMLDWINSEVLISVPEDEIEVNTEFDTFEHSGKSFWINKKYVVENRISHNGSQRNRQKKLKRFNKVIDTQFRFHYDTTLIKRDPNAISPSDLIHLSSKWHGCVDKDTIINTDRGQLTIGEIVNNKLDVLVEAFDTNSMQKQFVQIDDYYKIENDGEWFEIELENGQKIIITGNNPVWLPELNCYREVEKLKVGDTLLYND